MTRGRRLIAGSGKLSNFGVNPYESPQVEETSIRARDPRAAFWPLLWRGAMYSAFFGIALSGTGGAAIAVVCLPIVAIADGVVPTALDIVLTTFVAALMGGMLGGLLGAVVSPVAALSAKRSRRETLFPLRRNTMWAYAVLWMFAACLPAWGFWDVDGPSVRLAAFLCLAIGIATTVGATLGRIVAQRLHNYRFGNVPYSPFLHRQ
jgi:hypothetical protein